MVRGGKRLPEYDEQHGSLEQARTLHDAARGTLPWEGLALSRGDAAIPTRFVGFPDPLD